MADFRISEVLCYVCKNYRRTDKTTLLDNIARFYHDDELYAAKCELNDFVVSLSGPPIIDGWSKLINKQGLPTVRRASDGAMKRYADAEDLLQMLAVLDVQQIQLPTFVAADLDRIPGIGSCHRTPDGMLPPDTSKLSATVEELLKRFEVIEKRLQSPVVSVPAVPTHTVTVVADNPPVPVAVTSADGYSNSIVASAPGTSAQPGVRDSWAAQVSQLAATGMQPRKTPPVRVRGKSSCTTVKAVPRVLTCFAGRLSPDVTEEELTAMLEEKGIIGVRCKKIEPKNGRIYNTVAFRVSCSATYESLFYDESSWPEGAELRDWYFRSNNGSQ